MKKRVKKKFLVFRSKKGISLVELIVGIVILVMVFTSTLTAMTNGYTDTIFNADTNRHAVEGGSLNEIIMQSAIKQNFYDQDALEDYFIGSGKDPNKDDSNAIHAAAKALSPDIQYVAYENFPQTGADASETQYTVHFSASSTVTNGMKTYTVKGYEIQTYVVGVSGGLFNTSFIAYEKQS